MNMRLPRLQFSLRTLVIVVVIVAALASWHGSRYARHKARVAARVQAAEWGLLFQSKVDAGFLYGPENFSNREPTWIERYDQYCFGNEARRFEVCVLGMYDVTHHELPYQQNQFREVLELHPEVEVVDVSLQPIVNRKQKAFLSVSWAMGGVFQVQEEIRPIWEAMNELSQLPNLRYFRTNYPAEIRADWVAALPANNSIVKLCGKSELSSNDLELLVKKSPHLEEFVMENGSQLTILTTDVSAKYTFINQGSSILLKAKP